MSNRTTCYAIKTIKILFKENNRARKSITKFILFELSRSLYQILLIDDTKYKQIITSISRSYRLSHGGGSSTLRQRFLNGFKWKKLF